MRPYAIPLVFSFWSLNVEPALAQMADAGTLARAEQHPVWLDVEVDPFAYALEGYSVHVGLRSGHVRVDVGAFAASYPDFLASNSDLEGHARGAGLKLDWRFAQTAGISRDWLTELGRGGFVGVSGSYAWLVVTDPESSLSASQFQVHASVRAGWDVPIAAGFYLAPWASVGRVIGAQDLWVAGKRWEVSGLASFATIHVGWRPPWL